MLKHGRVVALDTHVEAARRASASTVLRFKLDAPLPPALRRRSRASPGRHRRSSPAHDAREVESMLARCASAGVAIAEDLEIGRADLEDVFLRDHARRDADAARHGRRRCRQA